MVTQGVGELVRRVDEAAEHVRLHTRHRPRLGIVLGSGLGAFAESLEGCDKLPYGHIPGMHAPTVPGHAGALYVGECEGLPVAVMSGRIHRYEGHPLSETTFPIRVLARLGVEAVLLTNSAGGITRGFGVGDLMVLTDHLNLTGENPLCGPNLEAFGPRFPDMTHAYDPALRAHILTAGQELGLTLREGVYAGLLGPSYETPAEIRMLRVMGADAVGMSTVAEAIVARHAGVKVAGISCISNLAAGMVDQALSHDDVKHAAALASDAFIRLLRRTCARLAA